MNPRVVACLAVQLWGCHSVASSHVPQQTTVAPRPTGLAAETPSELIDGYVFHPDCGFRTFGDGSAYMAALAHNKAITSELERRGDAAAPTCRRHLDDTRNIFTGDGGPAMNVALVCANVLTKLGEPHPSSLPMRFCSR